LDVDQTVREQEQKEKEEEEREEREKEQAKQEKEKRSLSTILRHFPFAFSVEPPDSQGVAT
jgi:RNA:NAD 2'-phosphotransferase (TPT1/KptA family)